MSKSEQKKLLTNLFNSGSFRRKVTKYKNISTNDAVVNINLSNIDGVRIEQNGSFSFVTDRDILNTNCHSNIRNEFENENNDSKTEMDWTYDGIQEHSPDEISGNELEILDSDDNARNLQAFLRNWSIQYNITQQAMKPLLEKLQQFDRLLPTEPRRLMRTPRSGPSVRDIGGGQYWHQGIGRGMHLQSLLSLDTFRFFYFVENCLRRCFPDLNNPKTIYINVNIDGLPLFNNGTDQVWPILFNLYEHPEINPMIIGIFYGRSKPKKIEEFLSPFVDEMVPILQNGILINGYQLNIKLRVFICDSPARAFCYLTK